MIEPTLLMSIDAFHYENTYKRLCQSDTGKSRKELSFPTMWELFVWGAILGYVNKCPKDIEKRYPTPPFRWQVIKDPHQKLLLVMAIESELSFDILKRPEDLKKNIESHSNGGLDFIHQEIALDPLAYQNVESLIFQIKGRLSV
jgi:hypothetical protein